METTNKHIVVADGEANVRACVVQLADEEGFTVTVAASGEEAIRALRQQTPWLLVLGERLPGLSEKAVLETLYGPLDSQAHNAVPFDVLFLMHPTHTMDGQRGFGIPVDMVMTRPFHPKELRAFVRWLWRRRNEENDVPKAV